MKICHICYFAARGGAATAAMRLHRALSKQGEDSRFMAVVHENLPDVIPLGTPRKLFFMRQFQRFVHQSYRLAKSTNYSGHTFQLFPGGLVPCFSSLSTEIVPLCNSTKALTSASPIPEPA